MNSLNIRVAVVAGARTPFLRIATGFSELPARTLAAKLVKELVQRADLDRSTVEKLVFGQVVMAPDAPNIAREIVMSANLPTSTDSYSVSRACASSYQSAADIALNIQSGIIDTGIAGGCDVMSQPPISFNKKMTEAMVRSSYSKGSKLKAFKGIGLRDLMPTQPAIKEPSSELTMGQAAEKMAKENGISRADQDALAHRSHTNAAQAWEQGWFDAQVAPILTGRDYTPVSKDNLFRADSELSKYAKLKPVFDRQYGSVTAANSSPLTDGASAVVLMREDKAKALGYTPLGYIKSFAFAALDPNWQMLMGPSFATPKALDLAGLSLADIDLIDMHEAFAAQVLSNTQAFASKQFAQERLNREQAIGEIDFDKLNITGSSISLGHPFAATGTRQLTQMLYDLQRTGKQHGLITACAAGGLGAAMVLESA
ncbi:3-ketoacyl-CoA thiolase [Arenicella chitinivorans]|uniref:3-ketoacyl-CoA thiolase n=1 Tax=Arenicella chitinivorans TaxID=1329800 RepID=A0A918RZW8_9GAMM|nr:acetyl-CoA C-acyltransferase FadI [Arenicella chitinivorans]GHA15130.1 3-ketoacyl-CoA thiolase [Arenicella chitinivorans]